MNPHREGPLAYWHCGGTIESRSGPLSQQRAVQLFVFYAVHALAAFEAEDAGAAVFCARMSLEVAAARIAAEIWKRANSAADTRARHEFSELWLRNGFIVKELLNYLDTLRRS
jgi:hypothetical protein